MTRYVMSILAMFLGFFQTPTAFADLQNIMIIDVRTSDEYQDSHVKDSINIDLLSSDFKSQIEKLDKNKTYKVYCRSGNRSGQAERIMKSLGFKDVENIGSVRQAAQRLKRKCEGKETC